MARKTYTDQFKRDAVVMVGSMKNRRSSYGGFGGRLSDKHAGQGLWGHDRALGVVYTVAPLLRVRLAP